MRPILATIHQAALRHNLAVVRSLAPRSAIMAVVKANGYGHGLLRTAQGLSQADGFAVLGIEEAVFLRESGFDQTILMLEGVFNALELNEASDADVSLVVHHEAQIRMLEEANIGKPVSVFAKMNTGMNRLGFISEDYVAAVERLKACRNVSSITLMTHFATADEDIGVTDAAHLFTNACAGMNLPISLANSAAILRYPETHADWVRPGIMLYGASPVSGTPASRFKLRPAMTLSSEIIAVQHLKPGESVGYGQRYTAIRDTRIGVVACGYADGYPRHAPNGTPIVVDGERTVTVGRVSMDMLFADITHLPEAGLGSPVELWGEQVSVDEVAEASGTVGYELLCALAARVPVRTQA